MLAYTAPSVAQVQPDRLLGAKCNATSLKVGDIIRYEENDESRIIISVPREDGDNITFQVESPSLVTYTSSIPRNAKVYLFASYKPVDRSIYSTELHNQLNETTTIVARGGRRGVPEPRKSGASR